jgi:hypothetical protein
MRPFRSRCLSRLSRLSTGLLFLAALGPAIAAVPSVPFVQNHGQHPPAVRFHAQTLGGSVFVLDDGTLRYALPHADGTDGWAIDERIAGENVEVLPGAKAGTRFSSFMGNDPAAWRSGLPCFETVLLRGVAPGIAVELRASGRNVEKVFTVSPGADAADIRIALEGCRALAVDADRGELVLGTDRGDVRFTRPIAWQEKDGARVFIDVAYQVHGSTYGFVLGEHDPALAVVIDPLLASTVLGGSNEDIPGEMVLDASGNVYLAATTGSADFPSTTGLIGTTNFDANVSVSILSPDLATLIASSVFGGDDNDVAGDLALVGGTEIVIVGSSLSTNFPTTAGAFQEKSNGDQEVFAVVITLDLSNLVAATHAGGFEADYATGVAVSTNGTIYIVGRTESTNFPVGTNDFQLSKTSQNIEMDAFVLHLDGGLTTLLDGTYLGDDLYDGATDIAIGPFGGVFVAGMTASPQFPTTPGSYDRFLNSLGDGFITSFEPDLDDILRSTLIGGDGLDSISAIAVTTGLVYVAGETRSDNFPVTPGAYDTTANGLTDFGDAFVARFDFLLNNLQAATFLGGTLPDTANDMALDATGNVYVAGTTLSADFPTVVDTDAKVGGTNNFDAYIARLTPNLAFLVYSRFLGGDEDDSARSVSVDADGRIYVSGIAGEGDAIAFPTTAGAFDASHNGSADLFVARVTPTPDASVAYDFDNDDRADLAVFHPQEGDWYIQNSGSGSLRLQQWGWEAATPAAADYDGDTIADLAVYFQDGGTWYVLRSSDSQYQEQAWGWSEAIPVPADFDGDAKADFAVYHPASGTWYIRQSSNGQLRQQQWGYEQAIPVPGDYDGDLVDDIAVFDPASSTWYVLRSADGQMLTQQWGFAGVSPVPGDYDGDGTTDIAVYEPFNAVWYVRLSSTGGLGGQQWGWSEVTPAPADYDGDGTDDVAVYHTPSGGWYISRSSDGELGLQSWGWYEANPIIRQNYINAGIPPIAIPID